MANFVECCACCKKPKAGLMSCSRCLAVKYCSRECQKYDWKNHKTVCVQLYDEFENLAADATKNLRAIFSNANFTSILKSLSYYWNPHNKGYIHCEIIPVNDNDKKFYKCKLEYRDGKVEELKPETLGIDVHYFPKPGARTFRITVNFNLMECLRAFTDKSKQITFHKLEEKELEIIADCVSFCSFPFGGTMY